MYTVYSEDQPLTLDFKTIVKSVFVKKIRIKKKKEKEKPNAAS